MLQFPVYLSNIALAAIQYLLAAKQSSNISAAIYMTAAWREWEGQVVNGKFCLRQHLGGNESSAVFRTEYGGPEPRKAAIKLVLAGPRETALLLSRWERAAELAHPHLMQLFDAGRWQMSDLSIPYVVMEYADEDLSQVLPYRPLTPPEAREVLEPALDVLAYLHGNGFVHRRLKPSNMMAVEDQLKVSSDSVVRAGEQGGRSSRTDVYEPPEIIGGAISPAADIWSLGVTLVEALTQRPPAPDEMAEGAFQQKLPPPFDEVVRNCLQPNPSARWTVANIAVRLQEETPAPSIQPISTARNTSDNPTSEKDVSGNGTSKTQSRRRYAVRVAALGLGLLIAAAVVAIVPGLRERAPEPARTPTAVELPRSRSMPESADSKVQPKPKIEEPSPAGPATRSQPKAHTAPGTTKPVDIVHRTVPSVPADIRAKITGTVRVSVKAFVDPSGNVAYANLDSEGPSRYFAEKSLEAARLWKFKAPNIDGRNASSIWILRFAFTSRGTNIVPVRSVP